jgi:hypothetical protein
MRGWARICVAVTAVLLAGCPLHHEEAPPYPVHPDRSVTAPPQDDLMLWIEADDPQTAQPTQQLDANGRVSQWNDQRGADRAVVALAGFAQSPMRLGLTVAGGARRDVVALSCRSAAGQICGYGYSGPNPHALDGTGHSIFGVVRRDSGRGDNYFLMTTGSGCSALFGGTGCTSNTALHLGWSGGTTARLGQYDNDAVLDDTTAFDETRSVVTLFSGISMFLGGTAHQIEYLDPDMNRGNSGGDATTLHDSGRLMIGGTGFTDSFGPGVPDWRFEGEIIAVLVYTRSLNIDGVHQAQSYLRNRFGPS